MSGERPLVCVTIDVEDWIQSTLDFDASLTLRCEHNTHAMLDFLDELGVPSTCFVQGMVAERFPQLVRLIAARGHEIASHAHTHRPLHRMNAAELRAELRHGKQVVEDAAGAPVRGFRAPDFSIGAPCHTLDEASRDVFRALADCGFGYDSSVVPARVRRYGVASAPRGPFLLREGLVEVPLSTLSLGGGRRLPALGGGYLRLLPLVYNRLALGQARRARRPSIVYLHPYELDVDELPAIARTRRVPLRLRLSQGVGRSGVRAKARHLLGRRPLEAITMGALVDRLRAGSPLEVH
jgi:polysaccharide deacetylase family protein (PEP-CTERM system associated)